MAAQRVSASRLIRINFNALIYLLGPTYLLPHPVTCCLLVVCVRYDVFTIATLRKTVSVVLKHSSLLWARQFEMWKMPNIAIDVAASLVTRVICGRSRNCWIYIWFYVSSFNNQPSPPWKSQIAHLDMHHLVFGINFQIHSVSLTILVSIHLLIHLSTHLCHHSHSCNPSLLHSFTPGSKPTFSTNPFHHTLLLPTDCLTITGLDRTYHAHHFVI